MAEAEERPSADVVSAVQTASAIALAEKMRAEGKTKGPTKDGKKLSKAEEKQLALRAAIKMDEHVIPKEQLFERFGVDWNNGLTTAQVKAKQAKEGKNQLTPPKEKPEWLKCLETQKGFFNILLWAGSVLCFIGYGLQGAVDNLYLGIVLATVVTVTGIFEYIQERNASNLMAQFKNMLPPKAMVKRNGKWNPLASIELCRGDVVRVSAGKKVPADIRVISASDDMKVEQSALTGEPDHIKRTPDCTNSENPLETANLCFFGTLCPSGTSDGIVVNIGDNTVMGRISAITTQTKEETSPIKKEINRFVLLVSAVAIFLGVTFFIIGAVLKTDPITNLVFMIGIIVANVPEGLLATVTVCLSLTAQRMYTKNVLVKQLESVETLGSTSCICSDKTGTLTINKMTVANICVDTSIFETEDGRTVSEAFPLCDPARDSIKKITRCMTNCNNAFWVSDSQVEQETDYERGVTKGDPIPFRKEILLGTGNIDRKIMWEPSGDASESAMIKFAQEQPLDSSAAYKAAGETEGSCPGIVAARSAYPKIKGMSGSSEKVWEIKFNSKNKYQVSVHKQPATEDKTSDERPALLLMKGAPERILNRCGHVWHNGERIPLTDEMRAKYEELNEELASMGRRCLAFCEQELDFEKYPPTWSDFEADPVNYPIGNAEEDVEKAIKLAKESGSSTIPSKASCEKLTYIGMTALIDPPRKQVPPAVEKCKSAGIKVVMVTGDHPATAQAIAKEVGIIWGQTESDIRKANKANPAFEGQEALPEDHPSYSVETDPDFAPAIVVPGWTFDHLTPADIWDDYLRHGQIVFARTSPQQKLIIVDEFQKRGQVVAVTGDGVNDAPALKKADIGVAMGIMGSDVSKEAANMILLDDNFASIVAGVEEGRLIFDNLKKSIAYTLSSNIPEISPFLAFITIGVPLPLSTILILCVDLGTDMVPAISMAWENHEADIMSRNPRDKDKDHLVTLKLVCFAYLQIGVIQALAGFFAWITVMNDYGYPSYTLPTLGQYDNWGKQQLFCKVSGGILRKENGEPYTDKMYDDMSMDEIKIAMANGFYFWDSDNVALSSHEKVQTVGEPGSKQFDVPIGKVKQCVFASKNFKGKETDEPSKASWNKFFGEGSPYYKDGKTSSEIDFTNSYMLATTQSILALHDQGYVEYFPFKSRMSPFYDNRWKKWPVIQRGEGLGVFGMGKDTVNSLHYQAAPVGFFTIPSVETERAKAGDNVLEADVTYRAYDIYSNLTRTWKVNSVGSGSMTETYAKALWNLPGRGYTNCDEPTCADSSLKVQQATDQGTGAVVEPHFTIYPRKANVYPTPHFEYLSKEQYVDYLKGTFTGVYVQLSNLGGSVVNKLYAWSEYGINGNGAPTSENSEVYANVAGRQMQKEALAHAQCAGFICIIVVQWADLMICKTRWLSLRQQGMVNPVMNFGLLFETILGCFLCYVPGLGDVLGTRPLRFQHWFPGMPFCLFIFFYDETRKSLMRATSKKVRDKDTKKTNNFPGWLERNTYY